VLFDAIVRGILILLLVVTCAARVVSQAVTPDVTQEVTRCLGMIRIATSRRGTALPNVPRATSPAVTGFNPFA
jgi:hypothetical protein